MKNLLDYGIKYLKKRNVDYADIRWVKTEEEEILVKNLGVEKISNSRGEGLCVRILCKGSWGFASSVGLNKSSLVDTIETAIDISKASLSINKKKIDLAYIEPTKGLYKSIIEIDPFDVPLEKKLDYLMWACHELKDHENIDTATCGLNFYRTNKLFFSTGGSIIEQEIIESGGFIEAIALLGNEIQKRSYPMPHGDAAQRGFEYVKKLDLVGNAPKIRDEAVSLLRAKDCPTKKTTLILDTSQLALQIHESCGHAAELDRVFGDEISFAGASFLTPEKLGHFRYGSKLVDITADATFEGGVGTFGYDDEGVPAQKVPLIKDGIFVGYLSSRETAPKINKRPSGAMRSSSYNNMPLVRMTNINLQPGECTLQELIKDTKDGVLLSTNKSWSIDDLRLNFQFGTEIGWQIQNGSITDVLKNPVYAGITPIFWRSLTAVANRDYFRMHGVLNCGKGEPMQQMRVGHGCSPARFEDVWVTSAKR